MKIVHIADLHLGKRLGEVSLMEDQRYILDQILEILKKEKAESLLISGDIYDRGVPPQEAVTLFSYFLAKARNMVDSVFIISGNHDSPERLSFGSEIFSSAGIHISGVFGGAMEKVTLKDGYGEIDIWMLPFIKPVNVRHFYPDIKEGGFEEAVRTVIKASRIDTSRRNILVAHQFVTSDSWPETSESETTFVGTAENIDYRVFDDFDYVALGHLHMPQHMGRAEVRYPGSPLKYSFSETRRDKSVTVLDVREKGNVEISTVPLKPLRDMREISGLMDEILKLEPSEDFMRVTLRDEYVAEAADRIRAVFPNVLRIDFDNEYTRSVKEGITEDIEGRGAIELFGEFYENIRGAGLTDEQTEIAARAFEEAKEETDETSLS